MTSRTTDLSSHKIRRNGTIPRIFSLLVLSGFQRWPRGFNSLEYSLIPAFFASQGPNRFNKISPLFAVGYPALVKVAKSYAQCVPFFPVDQLDISIQHVLEKANFKKWDLQGCPNVHYVIFLWYPVSELLSRFAFTQFIRYKYPSPSGSLGTHNCFGNRKRENLWVLILPVSGSCVNFLRSP